MNSDDALLFIRVAESLSFKDAAKQLGISRSAASKRIALLEKELGMTLINRTPRSISVTPAGVFVLDQCRVICAAVEAAREATQGSGLWPVGTLQMAICSSLGAALLPAILTDFMPNNPKVQLSIHYQDGPVDVVGGGFDVAIVLANKLEDSNLIARRIHTSRQVLVASPDYLKRRGTPRKLADLSDHNCIGFGYASKHRTNWQFATESELVDVSVRCGIKSNNYLALIMATCLNGGILYIPELLVQREIRDGRLQVINIGDHEPFEWGLYAIHRSRTVAGKVQAMIEFIADQIGAAGPLDQSSPGNQQALSS